MGSVGPHFRGWFAGILSSLWLAGVAGVSQDQPTAQQLIDNIVRVPIATTNPAVRSYEAEMESGGARVIFWYSQPYQTAVRVIDSRDGTPILVAANGWLAVYDTMAAKLLLATNQYAGLIISSKYSHEPGKSGVEFCLGMEGDPRKAQGKILFSRAIQATNLQTQIQNLGGGMFEIRGAETRKNPSTGQILKLMGKVVTDWPNQDLPYRNLEVQGSPVFGLTVKSINEPISKSAFLFPLDSLTTSGVPIERISPAAYSGVSQIMSILTANLAVRQAMALGDLQKTRDSIQNISRQLKANFQSQKNNTEEGSARDEILAEVSASFFRAAEKLDEVSLAELRTGDEKTSSQLRRIFLDSDPKK